ncbi:NPD-domain-containing protein [Karstenula rhodostoma CBS 690.94]|uniref:NPD-domain-containing protein n=1 Tax=Karstenula rhodostoma CBS 690.94 TaxID=1392251 RepID=A0A9P4U9P1_9PLEO|nr:NPD-domain-containing protein [Karstenula rhodostoma CBS 690.94]
MEGARQLREDYPWIHTPLVVGAPMRLIALADMAVEISKAGGLGFIGVGTDTSTLCSDLQAAAKLIDKSSIKTGHSVMPIGVGFINWGADLSTAIPLIAQYQPAAVWFFAPTSMSSLSKWTTQTRNASPRTKVWVQIGSVKEAVEAMQAARPDVLVVQGTDAGGHGLAQGASLITLLPEVSDNVSPKCGEGRYPQPILIAAGGIADARGVAAALALGAPGVVLGTRFLASPEANISKGYRDEILRANDGGQSTARSKIYDNLRGIAGWAETHNARGVINKSYVDAMAGMDEEENQKLYEEEVKKGDAGWGVEARMTTYAGSGVGLVRDVKPAGDIVREVREGSRAVLEGLSGGAVVGKL